ncbi:type II toxin-antitoxin system PemK/MazF family toxin [Bacillus altitudinis]|uniref:type II toxin-antitoxin system PemK/MazF family toxin n=1 Tax=Bacillus altitudinis TaxID=293387 RepID=UPI0024A946F6|nr:type II toxin-antitoxin system PemK/MazF family toxin [Bacillus altitudinis]WHF25371.1 type II toxin-antitoxin system PemK/MazF family toxin [Bacillus altitudinis]
MSKFNQNRKFIRGEVYNVNFPKEPKFGKEDSRMLEGVHRAIVLFDSTFPRKTVVVLPITSLYLDKTTTKNTISSDVVLKRLEYTGLTGKEQIHNNTITRDSFVMTNQIRSISRNHLQQFKGKILDKDMIKIDLQLINVLSLQETIEEIIEQRVEERLLEIVEQQEIENKQD